MQFVTTASFSSLVARFRRLAPAQLAPYAIDMGGLSAMNRAFGVVAFASVSACFPATALGCSLAGCLNGGVELQRTFVVSVKYAGKLIAGVRVDVKANGESRLSAITGPDGNARITNLTPGEYWLDTDLLGVSAGSQCFHVAPGWSLRARKRVSYDWAISRLASAEPRGANRLRAGKG